MIEEIISFIYNYCTTFIINIANIIDLSYYELNFGFFILLYPILLLVLPIILFVQKYRLKKLTQQFHKAP